MDQPSYVYLLASARNGTLYLGVTSDLIKRVWQHREGLADGFTKKYRVKQLLWFETHGDIIEAIRREKILKKTEPSFQDQSDSKGKSVLARLIRRHHRLVAEFVQSLKHAPRVTVVVIRTTSLVLALSVEPSSSRSGDPC